MVYGRQKLARVNPLASFAGTFRSILDYEIKKADQKVRWSLSIRSKHAHTLR